MKPTDFAPTLLTLLGMSPPADMTGRPHDGLLGGRRPRRRELDRDAEEA
jgi:hypothetical protein